VKGLHQLARLRRWMRERPRWPLTRQISLVFALAMLANATFVISVSSLWDAYIVDREFSTMSPGAQRTLARLKAGDVATPNDIAELNKELRPVQQRLEQRSSFVLYSLVALAAVVTFAMGYAILGRMGKGLVNVAEAARLIASGDLTARAAPIRLASREETQLTTDFNAMSAALQRAERELAESTASIAHELRTPLTILRGRLHGISDGVFELAPAEIDGLLFQVEGLGRLVDDLQTLSLATSNRLTLHVGDTDLAKEVRRVLAATRPDLEGAGLELVLDLSPTPLRADGVRIRQVIGAVLANVERYAADSGPLCIATIMIGAECVLTIADNGPGLPPIDLDRAFDRFWRGETSRSRVTGGSGLGLAVVRAIVDAHGGQATIQNRTEGGTVFEMRLPGGPRLHEISIGS
jgi:two-component system, OmpR family, sensor histidine kinase AdeS